MKFRDPEIPGYSTGRRPVLGFVLVLAVFILGAAGAEAFVRINLGGKTLFWTTSSLSWRLNPSSFSSVPGEGLDAAVEQGFQVWEDVEGSGLSFPRGADTTSVNWSDHSSRLVMVDNGNLSGFFPPGSGVVAITPIVYSTGSGQILDADILFNGSESFATDGSGSYDIQDILTHEVGHLVGLDHSPVRGATMWPWVSLNEWHHASLSGDEIMGAAAVSPVAGLSVLSGSVKKATGPAAKGALVSVIHQATGQLAATAVTNSSGSWTVKGLPDGAYLIYASPVEGSFSTSEGPAFTSNFTVDTDFGTEFYGGASSPIAFTVTSGSTTSCGQLNVPADSSLTDSNTSAYRVNPGNQVLVRIFGSGFGSSGSVSVTEMAPQLSVLAVSNTSSLIQATIQVSASCPVGLYDLYIQTSSGAIEAATGILDVVPPPPVVNSLNLTTGDSAGGTQVLLFGTGLDASSYVLFGGVEAQVDGVDSSGTTLQVTTPSMDPGPADVMVRNPSGQFTIIEDAFTFEAVPRLTYLFPTAGQNQGGTVILVSGTGFDPGMTATLGGNAAVVAFESSTFVRISSPMGSLGSSDLVLVNPGSSGEVITDAFQYVNTLDPTINDFTPKAGGLGGGTQVSMLGNNLLDTFQVKFGVDPQTGEGGQTAGGIQILSNSEVTTVTGSNPAPGSYGVLVELPNGQGAVATATFQFQGSASSTAGGGGCGGGIHGNPDPVGDLPAWILLLGIFQLLRRRARA